MRGWVFDINQQRISLAAILFSSILTGIPIRRIKMSPVSNDAGSAQPDPVDFVEIISSLSIKTTCVFSLVVLRIQDKRRVSRVVKSPVQNVRSALRRVMQTRQTRPSNRRFSKRGWRIAVAFVYSHNLTEFPYESHFDVNECGSTGARTNQMKYQTSGEERSE